ncbi:MAG: phenylalanine--tRNA ligase subunit alpha [Desulfurococcales archaeon]|nr:phenylalanine--tRNA ligase subunit alpha [Desulfurococcales archaeon]
MAEKLLVTDRQFRILGYIVGRKKEVPVHRIAEELGVKVEDIMRDLAELESKNLITIIRHVVEKYVLSSEGREVLEKGLPEERVYNVMYRCLDKPVKEFIECVSREAGLEPRYASIGFQHLVRTGCILVEGGRAILGSQDKCFELFNEISWIKGFLKKIVDEENIPREYTSLLRRRRFIEKEKETILYVKPTGRLVDLWYKGLITKAPLLTVVSPSILKEKGIEKVIIKEFDLRIPPPTLPVNRLSPYMEFLDLVREILISMGFEEVKGPHVELELWNFDVLFQAQDHPAREIHDTFFLETKLEHKLPSRELIERAKKVHERGWRYKWSVEKALTPILRTQTTAVSARTIYERGSGEYRCFSLDRVFRPETLDAKHAMEFYQFDGIIVGKNVSFKDLLAFFKEFAAALGIKKIWFKPGYFPFTEPSVEGFIEHPRLGWIEVFPGGMFRPEVMEILGAPDVKAAAWGIGIDRLAMTILGIDDIRDLFNKDLDYLESLPEPQLEYFKRKTRAVDVEVVKTINI